MLHRIDVFFYRTRITQITPRIYDSIFKIENTATFLQQFLLICKTIFDWALFFKQTTNIRSIICVRKWRMKYIWKLRNWNKIVIARAFEIGMSHYFSFELDLAKLEFVYYIISIDLFLTIYASISYSSINRTLISPPQILYFLIILLLILSSSFWTID